MKKRDLEKLFKDMKNDRLIDKVRNDTIVKIASYGCMKF